MKILFIHQNFPGQFLHLAPALARLGHTCVALTCREIDMETWNGVRILRYYPKLKGTEGLQPHLRHTDIQIQRGMALFQQALKLKESGLEPDVIIAHPGWGESLFVREVWPDARVGLFCEYFYGLKDGEIGFDPEFPRSDERLATIRMRLKNIFNLLNFNACELGISPTRFQADTYPPEFRDRISVIHDGIHTQRVVPNPEAKLDLDDGTVVTPQDEVISFVNRNLEPYRGYHVFMRALPELLRARPKARIVLIGGDSVSYGQQPPKGTTWKKLYSDEVRGQISDADWARVHFIGRVPYPRYLALMQVSTAHVYLTYPFVLSWSLIEAMSAGKAIVASDTAPVREAIKQDETGVLFPFFDHDALAKSVCALLDDPEKRAALGRAARAYAVENYDLAQCMKEQLAWVDRLYNMEASKLWEAP